MKNAIKVKNMPHFFCRRKKRYYFCDRFCSEVLCEY